MKYNPWLFAGIWGLVYAALKLLPQVTLARVLVDAGSLLVAGVIADLLVKFAVDFLPRELLPDLRNKAVFVTGCSSGFGLDIAKRLDALGVTVYAGLRNPNCPGALELKETCSKNLHIVLVDVTKDSEVQDAVSYVRSTIGEKVFWAVINNAGVAISSPTEWTSDQDFQKLWDTNTMGCVRMSKAFLPLLRRSTGRIVFVNSMAGLSALPIAVPYSITKFALTGFAEGLRREIYEWGVSVHSIHPFFYKTPMIEVDRHFRKVDDCWNSISEEVKDSYGEDFPINFKKYVKTLHVGIAYGAIDAPVEDTIDAAIGKTPKACYIPGWIPKLLIWGTKNIPRSIVDKIMQLHKQYT